jgi:hypothetical protein
MQNCCVVLRLIINCCWGIMLFNKKLFACFIGMLFITGCFKPSVCYKHPMRVSVFRPVSLAPKQDSLVAQASSSIMPKRALVDVFHRDAEVSLGCEVINKADSDSHAKKCRRADECSMQRNVVLLGKKKLIKSKS